MHLPLESLADNSCFHCTKILFHAMENAEFNLQMQQNSD